MNRWNDWWRQAHMELRAATNLQVTGDHAWCCFTCQQAAEKALKAVLEQRGHEHEGHSLNLLLRRLFGEDDPPRELVRACARLSRLYIPTRYPDAVVEGAPADQYLEEDAQQSLEDLRVIVDYVGRAVGQTPS